MIHPVQSIPSIDPKDPVLQRFVRSIPIAFARRHHLFVCTNNEGFPSLYTTEPDQAVLRSDHISRALEMPLALHPIGLEPQELRESIDRSYQVAAVGLSDHTLDLGENSEDFLVSSDNDLLDADTRSHAVRTVAASLRQAHALGASDLHVQPYANGASLRVRTNGVLRELRDVSADEFAGIVTRLKVMGGMDVAKSLVPQDGRATVQIGQVNIDLRIATIPTAYGERVVIRLLADRDGVISIDALGMPDDIRNAFQRAVHAEHGMALVTGPTGSGKTTTLYAALQTLDAERLSILTIEDPIEYRLAGVSQSQVNDKRDFRFAAGLRSMLRQDPDVIMVGEIRDPETAMVAVQASLTGHLVLSTLHTNDAAGALVRLVNLDVPPFLVASAVSCVLAQRLLRARCHDCTVDTSHDCSICGGTRVSGRLAAFELLLCDESVRQEITNGASASAIALAAAHQPTLRKLAIAAEALFEQGFVGQSELDRVFTTCGELV